MRIHSRSCAFSAINCNYDTICPMLGKKARYYAACLLAGASKQQKIFCHLSPCGNVETSDWYVEHLKLSGYAEYISVARQRQFGS